MKNPDIETPMKDNSVSLCVGLFHTLPALARSPLLLSLSKSALNSDEKPFCTDDVTIPTLVPQVATVRVTLLSVAGPPPSLGCAPFGFIGNNTWVRCERMSTRLTWSEDSLDGVLVLLVSFQDSIERRLTDVAIPCAMCPAQQHGSKINASYVGY